MTHKHHITPRSSGGTNDPDNLVEVSVEEHAEIHRCLWIYGGRWQDELAWKGLTKCIGKEEIQKEIARQIGRKQKGIPKSDKAKENMSKAAKQRKMNGNHIFLSSKWQRENQLNRVARGTHTWQSKKYHKLLTEKRLKDGTHNFLGPKGNRQMLANGTHPSQKEWKCTVCGVEGKGTANLKRWHSHK